MTARTTITWQEKALMVLLLTCLACYFNRDLTLHCSYPEMVKQNDVLSILDGYNKAPHLFPDSLRWWHGSWIQTGIPAFRPLTSYLYWTDCYLGMHYGFAAAAWLGFALLVVNCLLASALAWRFTGSRLLMVGAGVLATMVRFYNVPMSPQWLNWFPCHQELFMNAFLLGAALCFDVARMEGKLRYFAYSWCLFVLGCFAKETVYIFPLMALMLMLGRPPASQRAYRISIVYYCTAMLWDGMLWVYRNAIIEHPRTPELHAYRQLLFKPMCFMYTTFYRYTATKDPDVWFAGLALVIFLLAGLYLKLRKIPLEFELIPATPIVRWNFGKSTPILSADGDETNSDTVISHDLERTYPSKSEKFEFYIGLLRKPMIYGLFSLIVITIYVNLVGHSALETALWLFDPAGIFRQAQFTDMCDMVLIIYYSYLFFKYRRIEPTFAIWALLYLEYAPDITYIGWHYTLPAWFVQSAYICMVAKVMWIDWGKPLEKYLTRPAASEISVLPAVEGQLSVG